MRNFLDFLIVYLFRMIKLLKCRGMGFPTMCCQQSLRSACAYAQSGQSLCLSLEYSRSVKLLTEHLLEFLNLKGGCTGLSESTLVKMPHCWNSHAVAQIILLDIMYTVIGTFKFSHLAYVR